MQYKHNFLIEISVLLKMKFGIDNVFVLKKNQQLRKQIAAYKNNRENKFDRI